MAYRKLMKFLEDKCAGVGKLRNEKGNLETDKMEPSSRLAFRF
jgi:hypothetical protein